MPLAPANRSRDGRTFPPSDTFKPLLKRIVEIPEYLSAPISPFDTSALYPTALHIRRVECRLGSLAAAATVLREPETATTTPTSTRPTLLSVPVPAQLPLLTFTPPRPQQHGCSASTSGSASLIGSLFYFFATPPTAAAPPTATVISIDTSLHIVPGPIMAKTGSASLVG